MYIKQLVCLSQFENAKRVLLINLSAKTNDWNSDVSLSRVLFEAIATTRGKMKLLAHKAA